MNNNPVRFRLVRHGQTWSNLRHMMIGGGGSAPLTPKGRLAAKHLGLGMREIRFTAAYASPLGRAMETAQLILGNNATPPPLQEAEGLKDVFWGDLEGGIPDDVHAMKTKYADDPLFPMGGLNAPDYKTVYGGESVCDFIVRFEQTLHDIASRHPEGGDILVVSHAALGSFLAKHGAPVDQMDTANISTLPEVANTSVSTVILENGKFRVEKTNDLSFIHAGEKLASGRAPLQLHLFTDPETFYETKGLLLGCADSRLSARGIQQAADLHARYAGHPFVAAYSSPLGRARELCRRVTGAEQEPIAALREIGLAHWEAEKKATLSEHFPSEYRALSGGGSGLLQYISPVGGESGIAAANRLDACLREIGERHEFSGGGVSVFTHRMVLRAWLALHGQGTLSDADSELRFTYQNGEFAPVKQ